MENEKLIKDAQDRAAQEQAAAIVACKPLVISFNQAAIHFASSQVATTKLIVAIALTLTATISGLSATIQQWTASGAKRDVTRALCNVMLVLSGIASKVRSPKQKVGEAIAWDYHAKSGIDPTTVSLFPTLAARALFVVAAMLSALAKTNEGKEQADQRLFSDTFSVEPDGTPFVPSWLFDSDQKGDGRSPLDSRKGRTLANAVKNSRAKLGLQDKRQAIVDTPETLPGAASLTKGVHLQALSEYVTKAVTTADGDVAIFETVFTAADIVHLSDIVRGINAMRGGPAFIVNVLEGHDDEADQPEHKPSKKRKAA